MSESFSTESEESLSESALSVPPESDTLFSSEPTSSSSESLLSSSLESVMARTIILSACVLAFPLSIQAETTCFRNKNNKKYQ